MIYYKLRHNLIIPYQFGSKSSKVDPSHTMHILLLSSIHCFPFTNALYFVDENIHQYKCSYVE